MTITFTAKSIYILAILAGYANQNCVRGLGTKSPESPPRLTAEGSEAKSIRFVKGNKKATLTDGFF